MGKGGGKEREKEEKRQRKKEKKKERKKENRKKKRKKERKEEGDRNEERKAGRENRKWVGPFNCSQLFHTINSAFWLLHQRQLFHLPVYFAAKQRLVFLIKCFGH